MQNIAQQVGITARAIEQYREVLVLELMAGTEKETAIALARCSAMYKAECEFQLLEESSSCDS